MKLSVSELTKSSLEELDEIHSFFALTHLSYTFFAREVSRGYRTKAIISDRNLELDQDSLKVKFDNYGKTYLSEIAFQLSVSAFEVWFFDLLKTLLSDPNRLNKKRKIDVADVISAASLEDLLACIADSEINEIRYKKPAEWFLYLGSFITINSPSQDDIEKVSEIKASRDILAHNNGIANQIYIAKSGRFSRVKSGDPIEISQKYFIQSWRHLRDIVDTVGARVSERITN